MSWSGGNHALGTLPTQAEVEAMLASAGASYSVKYVPANAVLFWEGEPHHNHYYLVDGTVEVYKVDSQYRKKCIDLYRPGSFFGFQILTETHLPMTTARACTDCHLIVIPCESFFQVLHSCPAFANTSMRYLFGLLSMQTSEVVNTSFYAASQRVAMLLLALAQDIEDRQKTLDTNIVLPYGNNEIAEMLGVSRNSVTSALSGLRQQGVIETQRNTIVVVNMDKLDKIAHFNEVG